MIKVWGRFFSWISIIEKFSLLLNNFLKIWFVKKWPPWEHFILPIILYPLVYRSPIQSKILWFTNSLEFLSPSSFPNASSIYYLIVSPLVIVYLVIVESLVIVDIFSWLIVYFSLCLSQNNGFSCKDCIGNCCTFSSNSMMISPLEAFDILNFHFFDQISDLNF